MEGWDRWGGLVMTQLPPLLSSPSSPRQHFDRPEGAVLLVDYDPLSLVSGRGGWVHGSECQRIPTPSPSLSQELNPDNCLIVR